MRYHHFGWLFPLLLRTESFVKQAAQHFLMPGVPFVKLGAQARHVRPRVVNFRARDCCCFGRYSGLFACGCSGLYCHRRDLCGFLGLFCCYLCGYGRIHGGVLHARSALGFGLVILHRGDCGSRACRSRFD
jgi:hypothetical protein